MSRTVAHLRDNILRATLILPYTPNFTEFILRFYILLELLKLNVLFGSFNCINDLLAFNQINFIRINK